MASAFSKQDKFFLTALLVVFVLSLLVWAWDWDRKQSGETPASSFTQWFRQPENAQVPNELLQKAQSGKAVDLYAVGHFYKMQNDWQNAVIWYEKAAALGYSKAYSNLGVAYVEGYGVQRDVLKACQYFDLAYETMHDAVNAANVAFCANHGDNPQRDVAKAFRFYKLAAEQGNMPQEQRNLGLMYFDGEGGYQSEELSVYWLRQAIANGDTRAMMWLARAYYYNKGVKRHPDNKYIAHILLKATYVKGNREDRAAFTRAGLEPILRQGEKTFALQMRHDLKKISGREILAYIDSIAPYTEPNVAALEQKIMGQAAASSESK